MKENDTFKTMSKKEWLTPGLVQFGLMDVERVWKPRENELDKTRSSWYTQESIKGA